jgi:hypothetical protein
MRRPLFTEVRQTISIHLDTLNRRFIHWTTLSTQRHPVALGADLARSKPALIAENTLLRQQLIVLQRQVARPLWWTVRPSAQH